MVNCEAYLNSTDLGGGYTRQALIPIDIVSKKILKVLNVILETIFI